MSHLIVLRRRAALLLGVGGLVALLAALTIAAPAQAASGPPPPYQALTLTVLNGQTGQPLAGATVYAFDMNGKQVGEAISPVTGQVTFYLPAGAYELIAKRLGYQTAATKALLPDPTARALTIALQPLFWDSPPPSGTAPSTN